MRDNRGIDRDIGALPRRLDDLQQQINDVRSERRASATAVEGDLTVEGSGRIVVQDNGQVFIGDGGVVESPTLSIGSIIDPWAPLKQSGRQILLRNPTTSGTVFQAYEWNGETFVAVGGGTGGDSPVDSFSAIATDIYLTATNGVTIGGPGIFPATTSLTLRIAATTSNSPNLTLDAGSFSVARSTSSRRYKQDIADVDVDPVAVLKLRPRSWRDRAEVKADPDTTRRYIGFIAEELHDLGLTQFVTYDDEGRPDAVEYDRLSVALFTSLRWLVGKLKNERDRINALEATVTAQQQQIDTLAAQVAALTNPTP